MLQDVMEQKKILGDNGKLYAIHLIIMELLTDNAILLVASLAMDS